MPNTNDDNINEQSSEFEENKLDYKAEIKKINDIFKGMQGLRGLTSIGVLGLATSDVLSKDSEAPALTPIVTEAIYVFLVVASFTYFFSRHHKNFKKDFSINQMFMLFCTVLSAVSIGLLSSDLKTETHKSTIGYALLGTSILFSQYSFWDNNKDPKMNLIDQLESVKATMKDLEKDINGQDQKNSILMPQLNT